MPSGEFSAHCAFQPVPKLYSRKAIEINGGNVFGLEKYPHDAILLQASAAVKTPELAEWVNERIRALIGEVRSFAGEDRLCPWLYINYAHPSQKVLESYGEENLKKIREVAAKYDPEGVFTRLCPGGFKIPSE